MDTKLGTAWVAPGQGVAAEKLWAAVNDAACVSEWEREQALFHLESVSSAFTNLRLTGLPLTDYDLKRIAVCE